jgi:hypothetical protein
MELAFPATRAVPRAKARAKFAEPSAKVTPPVMARASLMTFLLLVRELAGQKTRT